MLQSLYLKNADLSWLKGTAYPVAPATTYTSLHSANPFLDGANQITIGRQPVTAWSAIANSSRSIAQDLNWGTASINGSATHWGLWDAATGGNFLGGAKLKDLNGIDYTLPIVTGSQIFIGQNSLIVGYANGVFSDYFINKKLAWFGGTAFGTAPSALYGAFGSSLLLDGTGSYLSIPRKAIAFGANTSVGDYQEIANSATENFADSNAIATINGCGFFDALTGGNLIALGTYADIPIIVGTKLFLTPNSVRLQC